MAPHPDRVAFAQPLWSELKLLHAMLNRGTLSPAVIIAPTVPAGWWAPHLAALQAAAGASYPLGTQATTPPIPGTPRDPRPLTAYFIGEIPATARPRPLWWSPWCLTADGDIQDNPGPPKTTSAHCLLFGPAAPPAPPDPPRPPVPPLRPPPATATEAQPPKPAPVKPRISKPADAHSLLFGAGAATRGPSSHEPAPPPIPRSSVVASAATPVPPPDGIPPPTMADWCNAMLRTAALIPAAVQLPPGVAAVHAPAVAKAGTTAARKANIGSSAPERLPRMLLQFAELRGVLNHPWSLPQLEAFTLDYCQARLIPKPPCGWDRLAHASDVLNEASRIAATSRRVMDGPWRFPAPPYCGSAVKAWAVSRGAKETPEHSAAFPVHMTDILDAMPSDPASRHYRAARAWFVMSIFGLRTGILFHLYSNMFIPYDGGYLLVWRFVQKRTTGDAEDEDALSRIGAITAARHPLLHAIIRHSEGDHRIFEGLTHQELSAFVHLCVPDSPPGFDVRSYGARTAADAATELLMLPDDLARKIMWWKRSKPDMRGYYGGSSIRSMYLFSERRMFIRASHVLPGVRDAVLTRGGLTNWDTPVASTLPPLPNYEHVLAALRATCPSLAVSRRTRGAARAERARRTLGLGPSPTLPDGPTEVLEGYCCRCYERVTAEVEAASCVCCDELACTACHPDLDEDFRCPAHTDRPTLKRARAASGAGAGGAGGR